MISPMIEAANAKLAQELREAQQGLADARRLAAKMTHERDRLAFVLKIALFARPVPTLLSGDRMILESCGVIT
jgi:hypothetical protein